MIGQYARYVQPLYRGVVGETVPTHDDMNAVFRQTSPQMFPGRSRHIDCADVQSCRASDLDRRLDGVAVGPPSRIALSPVRGAAFLPAPRRTDVHGAVP